MTTDQLLAELEVRLAARRERKMGDYKLVPVEPTTEMAYAGIEVYGLEDCADADVHAVWEAMLAAAPAVQGGPCVSALVEALMSDLSARINRVSRRSLDGNVVMSSEEWNGIVGLVKKLLTATPQPSEHHIADETPARTSFGGPQRFATAKQQPAPDVAGLVEARKVVALPITTEVGGQEWYLYTYDYATQDGEFSGYLYALDMGHAEQLLAELKATAVLAGQMIEVIDADPQAVTPC